MHPERLAGQPDVARRGSDASSPTRNETLKTVTICHLPCTKDTSVASEDLMERKSTLWPGHLCIHSKTSGRATPGMAGGWADDRPGHSVPQGRKAGERNDVVSRRVPRTTEGEELFTESSIELRATFCCSMRLRTMQS